ncbi:potassium channel family protein [Sediminitomix flava]|uniref:Ion channel n=1 Tax=Sediminitomix flava TaxID=379075 RepID=A0A315ZDU4_SEDFL|nr:potassium channel family protein [Sediminitomix flava]PWJ42924.1 ion channel [Sediminitomix flava]
MNYSSLRKIVWIYQWRYSIYLFSFLWMLFGDLLTPNDYDSFADALYLFQNITISAILFIKRSKFERTLVVVLILLAFVSRFEELFIAHRMSFVFPLTYLFYFFLVSNRIYMDILRLRMVDIDLISAVFCGFILMGVLGAIIFMSIDNAATAFDGIDNQFFPDFLYFSFITLLTIGYGDISPATDVSRRLVVLFGLIGNFYTVFVTAIVIGKYQSQSSLRRRRKRRRKRK